MAYIMDTNEEERVKVSFLYLVLGKKIGAAQMQTSMFAASHKKADRPHPQQQQQQLKHYLVDL
jgi:hypothetical protein